MVRPRKPITDPTLKQWLSEFSNKNTKRQYCSAMRLFKKNLGIEDLGEYLKTDPDAAVDIRRFISSMADKPKKSLLTYTTILKVFYQDNKVVLDDYNWKKLRRRGFIPKHPRAETRDKKPSIQQLKKILNYMDIKGRAMVLFLLSSGARIGETLQLKKEDFNFDADPPRVFIRGEYTKGGVGQRTVFFSYEAKDAILDWLKIQARTGKRDGRTHQDERVFSWGLFTARDMWNRAIAKAGIDQKDKKTGRRIYHLHSLRKFFRTKIGLDLDTTNALMGHVEYLDESYLRQEHEEIARTYLEAMPNVSVYSIGDNELRQETQELKDEMQTLAQKENQKDKRIEELEKQLAYFKSPEFSKSIMDGIREISKPLRIPETEQGKGIDVKKIPKEELDTFIELRKKGYNMTYENDTYIIMEKE